MKGEEEDRGAAGEKFLTVEVRGVTSEVVRSHGPVGWIFILFSLFWYYEVIRSYCPVNWILIEKSELPLGDLLHEDKSVSVLQFEVFQNIDKLCLYEISVGFIPNKEWFLLSK